MQDIKEEHMKIVILDAGAANPGDISWEELDKFGEVVIYDYTEPCDVVSRLKGAQIALTNKTCFTEEVISALPDLKYIGVLATGYNVIDLKAAKLHGITVTNIPAYSTDSVAQHTFAFILNFTNKVAAHN